MWQKERQSQQKLSTKIKIKECSVRMTSSSRVASVVCGTPILPPNTTTTTHALSLHLSLSLCTLRLSSSPSFLSLPCYQPGCRRGGRPRRGAHEAQTACLPLFFLSVLSARDRTPSGGAIQCDKLPSHPKKTARTHARMLDLEKTHHNVVLLEFVPHMQTSMYSQ